MEDLLAYSSKSSYLDLTIQDVAQLKPQIKIIRRLSMSDRGEGEVYEAKMANREVILKTSQYLDNLYYEYNVGLKINTILDQVDTFVETLGMFLIEKDEYDNLFNPSPAPVDNNPSDIEDNQEYETTDNQEYETTDNNDQEYDPEGPEGPEGSEGSEGSEESEGDANEQESAPVLIGILILEKVPGLTIYDILPAPSENDGSQKPLYLFTEDQILDILSQIASALSAAQQRIEFTHYDLHPGNVMIIAEKNKLKVKIIDYGFSHVAFDYEEAFFDKLLCVPKSTVIDCGVIPAIFDPDNDILNILQIIDIIAYYVSKFDFNKNYAKLKPLHNYMDDLYKNKKLGACEVDWPLFSDSAVENLPTYIYHYNAPSAPLSTQEAQYILDNKPMNPKKLSDLLSNVKLYNVQQRPFLVLPKILSLLQPS